MPLSYTLPTTVPTLADLQSVTPKGNYDAVYVVGD